jgi:hypothetical protein
VLVRMAPMDYEISAIECVGSVSIINLDDIFDLDRHAQSERMLSG